MHPDIVRSFQHAVQLQQQGKLDAAADTCQSVIKKVPQEPDPLHLLGLIRKQQGQHEEAERLLRASIEKAPNRPNFHGNLGNLLSNLGRLGDAEKAYRQALALDNDFRPARLGLARLLNEAGIHDAAEREADTLLDENPDDAEALAALGVALVGQSRYAEAEDAYRKALEIAPGYGAARHNLGAMLAKVERVEESLAELDRATDAGIRGVEIDFNRSSALMKLYRFEEGEQLLASSVKATPTYADAQKLLAQFRFMRGDENFADELGRATQDYPDNPELQLAFAQVLHGANRLEDAELALTTALTHCKSHPRLLGVLASVYQEAGRFEEALQSAQNAVNAEPTDQLLADYVIDALMSLGRADEAMPLIASARERMPNNQWYIAIESTAARLLGDPRYEFLCDYEEMVRSFELEPPRGWSSMEDFHQELLPALHARHRFYAHPLDYYAEVPDEVDDASAKSGWIKFGEPRYPVPGATAEKYVQPKQGRLVLFPSYMWHGTTPIHGDEPRMTVAFDVVNTEAGD
jgi:tetratricopeptide (TPR) repeat protein